MAKTARQADRYVLNGTTYVIDPQTKLGSGSEGMVLQHPTDPSLCIKVFHPAEPGDKSALDLARYRSRKIQYITGHPPALPQQFTLPRRPVRDPGQNIIGFEMLRIPPDYAKLMKLLDSTFRTDMKIGLRSVSELFAQIFGDLSVIHDHGLVIGDVNLGCLMFQPGGGRAWVDTDSWSYPGFPCLATTELFAHPDLYANLDGSNGQLVPAQPQHDRFAFTVAYVQTALPGAHPFRMGSHPTVKGLQNRAQAGITIFDPDVQVPKLLGTFDVLSDELLHELVTRLKRRTNKPLDPALLTQFAQEVIVCSKCGTEYHSSRRQCPQCQEVTIIQVTKLVQYIIDELFAIRGVLLFAQALGSDLYLVCRTDKGVRVVRVNEQGAVTNLSPYLPDVPGARYRFFKDYLVVCENPRRPAPVPLQLFRISGHQLEPRSGSATGGLAGGDAVFDTSGRFLYRTTGNTIVRTDLFGAADTLYDQPVAEVYQSQSWFTADHVTGADRELIVGFDRALRLRQWFIIRGDADGSHYRHYDLGDLGVRVGETIEDSAVHFGAASVLIAMQTRYRGREYVRIVTVGIDGQVVTNRTINTGDDTFPYWTDLRGKLYQGKSILHVTPDGIVKQDLTTDECTTLTDTTGVVTLGDRLLRLFGRVGIVRRTGVLSLRPKQQQ
jgi:hypothetical protein